MTRQYLGFLCAALIAAASPLAVQAQTPSSAPVPAAQAFGAPPAAPVQKPGPAAPGGHIDVDARCVALGLVMANSPVPANRQLGPQIATYFLGRMDGKGGKASLDARLSAQFSSLSPGDISNQAGACLQMAMKRAADLRTSEIRMLKKYGQPVKPGAGAAAAPAH